MLVETEGSPSVGFAPLIPHQVSATVFTAGTPDGSLHLMLPVSGGYETVDGSGIWYNGSTAATGGVITAVINIDHDDFFELPLSKEGAGSLIRRTVS